MKRQGFNAGGKTWKKGVPRILKSGKQDFTKKTSSKGSQRVRRAKVNRWRRERKGTGEGKWATIFKETCLRGDL